MKTTYTWEQAFERVRELNKENYGGENDWRLPTIRELANIINYDRADPACILSSTIVYPYWSATPDVIDDDNAWSVSFHKGEVTTSRKTFTYYIRAVRGTLPHLMWSKTL